MAYTDKEIIDAIKAGSEREVLNFLYHSLFPKVKKYIYHHSGDRDIAFDIFQDSIMVFYKYVKINRFDANYSISAFIFSVSKNILLNRLRKEKREIKIPDHYDVPDSDENILKHIISREREEKISDILSKLGQKCEMLLRYSIYYKLKNTEICEKMGFKTEDAVKTRKYKCMQKLISIVESQPSIKQFMKDI
jgi:RNA polymerase sigma factor (sigma-70 family)